jgi:hypothetical protein
MAFLVSLDGALPPPLIPSSATVLLHNGGFGNNCTPKRCISKQMQYKTPFSHKGDMKNLEIYENYITLF